MEKFASYHGILLSLGLIVQLCLGAGVVMVPQDAAGQERAAESPAASPEGLSGASLGDSGLTTLERVRKAGVVTCGVDATPGFSAFDTLGNPIGFDVDFCRAIAAAVLGDAEAIQTRRISTVSKFDAVLRGELDVSFGMTSWTLTRDTVLGTAFPTVIFHDGQGFMAWSDSGVKSLADLNGQSVCVQSSTTSEGNLWELIERRGLKTEIINAPNTEEKLNLFAQRRCMVVTGDRSELAAHAAVLEPGKGAWHILDETISAEPLSPVVKADDWQWFNIVRWVVNATLAAEQLGLGQGNLPPLGTAATGERARLLGQEQGFGRGLGLEQDWAYQVIAQVGAYDEIFMRNLSPMGLSRGTNTLARDGGVFMPLPMR